MNYLIKVIEEIDLLPLSTIRELNYWQSLSFTLLLPPFSVATSLLRERVKEGVFIGQGNLAANTGH